MRHLILVSLLISATALAQTDSPSLVSPNGRLTEIYAVAPDTSEQPKHVVISKKTVTRTSVLKIALAPGGGCAVRFVPKS
jgi:hypothetical protein